MFTRRIWFWTLTLYVPQQHNITETTTVGYRVDHVRPSKKFYQALFSGGHNGIDSIPTIVSL